MALFPAAGIGTGANGDPQESAAPGQQLGLDAADNETPSHFVLGSKLPVADRVNSSDNATVRPAATVALLELAPGTIAVLRQVIDDESRVVLRSLGLTDGARLRICRLGDPCIIQVRSTRIGLSKVVARSIYVAVADRDVQ